MSFFMIKHISSFCYTRDSLSWLDTFILQAEIGQPFFFLIMRLCALPLDVTEEAKEFFTVLASVTAV